MPAKKTNCVICKRIIDQDTTGEPFLIFKGENLCSGCYCDLIPEIYKMAGAGDGGTIHMAFSECLSSSHSRKRRPTLDE